MGFASRMRSTACSTPSRPCLLARLSVRVRSAGQIRRVHRLVALTAWVAVACACVPGPPPPRLTVVRHQTTEAPAAPPAAGRWGAPAPRPSPGAGPIQAWPRTLFARAADAALRSGLQAYGIVGARLAVVDAEAEVWTQGYGVADASAAQPSPIDARAGFAVGARLVPFGAAPGATSVGEAVRGHVVALASGTVAPVARVARATTWTDDALVRATTRFARAAAAPGLAAAAAGAWEALEDAPDGFVARLARSCGGKVAYGVLFNVAPNAGTDALIAQLEATLLAYARGCAPSPGARGGAEPGAAAAIRSATAADSGGGATSCASRP